ncbi:MAG: carboxypeptidase-like regulatory domain-containing protein [Chloroflexia bacterium]|nr:carboxypeptidase-like regulatory domain-containing protein [Chloroflexia bacterium]
MKMLPYKLLLLVAVFFTPLLLFAQTGGIIKGHVHDTICNIPLVLASVSIEDKNLKAITDEEGNFVLENVPAGVHH